MSAVHDSWSANPEFVVYKFGDIPRGVRCDGVFVIFANGKKGGPDQILHIDHSHIGGDVYGMIDLELKRRLALGQHVADRVAVKTFAFNGSKAIFLRLLEEQCEMLKAKYAAAGAGS